ncbi:helix-turn-helix domain-containing protein [Longimicrobium sp.]|jgi:transposase-like protein|uniref:helix-turn-helix domain-containing protein n=1 Tax=Longimicrobium sp. TaxID=2029185 RepID=UPI0039C9DBCB
MDAASERARFRDAVDRLRQSCGYSMDEVAQEFGVSLNLAHRWRAETGRHKPRAGWESILAGMAERGAAANRERADGAERLAAELRDKDH